MGFPRARALDTDAFGRTKAEQDAAALPVLAGAFELVAAGWVRTLDLTQWGNTPIPRDAVDLSGAINSSGVDPVLMDLVYARRLLRKLVGDFNVWSEHPLCTQEDVLLLLRKAIVLGGGEPPAMPRKRKPHRGGWCIGGVR